MKGLKMSSPNNRRHHYVFPAREENGPRLEYEWHPGKRDMCSICRTDNTGNNFPNPIRLDAKTMRERVTPKVMEGAKHGAA
jgi:hypothetical protein